MNFLPKVIENIIITYKKEMEYVEKFQPLLDDIKTIKNKINHIDTNYHEVVILVKDKTHYFEMCCNCGNFIGSMNLTDNNMCKCDEE